MSPPYVPHEQQGARDAVRSGLPRALRVRVSSMRPEGSYAIDNRGEAAE